MDDRQQRNKVAVSNNCNALITSNKATKGVIQMFYIDIDQEILGAIQEYLVNMEI